MANWQGYDFPKKSACRLRFGSGRVNSQAEARPNWRPVLQDSWERAEELGLSLHRATGQRLGWGEAPAEAGGGQ